MGLSPSSATTYSIITMMMTMTMTMTTTYRLSELLLCSKKQIASTLVATITITALSTLGLLEQRSRPLEERQVAAGPRLDGYGELDVDQLESRASLRSASFTTADDLVVRGIIDSKTTYVPQLIRLWSFVVQRLVEECISLGLICVCVCDRESVAIPVCRRMVLHTDHVQVAHTSIYTLQVTRQNHDRHCWKLLT